MLRTNWFAFSLALLYPLIAFAKEERVAVFVGVNAIVSQLF